MHSYIVLRDVWIDGRLRREDEIVELPAAVAKYHVADGALDVIIDSADDDLEPLADGAD